MKELSLLAAVARMIKTLEGAYSISVHHDPRSVPPATHSEVYNLWESDEEDVYKAQEGIRFDGENDEDMGDKMRKRDPYRKRTKEKRSAMNVYPSRTTRRLGSKESKLLAPSTHLQAYDNLKRLGSLSALISYPRTTYQENGGCPKSSPFTTPATYIYLCEFLTGLHKVRRLWKPSPSLSPDLDSSSNTAILIFTWQMNAMKCFRK
ncbi:hypothetical protein Cgig2_023817 [Carnegiea gigantea]|uniref:Uncharacterized protein n=1 Tax=Carnegiea gigantea TaxID=171969 RepID=A0A9Q1JYH0_9CARY|nr:hypothetical protein Cgig2_023817 [Carnegiea gigantea]